MVSLYLKREIFSISTYFRTTLFVETVRLKEKKDINTVNTNFK